MFWLLKMIKKEQNKHIFPSMFSVVKMILLMFTGGEKQHYLAVKKISYHEALHRSKMMIIVLTVFINLEQKINLKLTRMSVKIITTVI